MHLSIIVATLEGCPFELLDDPEAIAQALHESVQAGGFTMLHDYVHQFAPQGVTGAAVLGESHVALHTWPEHGVLFVDIATCSGGEATERAFRRICELFPHESINRQDIGFRGPSEVAPGESTILDPRVIQ